MSELDYAIARIRGMKSFLVKDNEIRIALELPKTSDFCVWLENTPYKTEMEKKTIQEAERALFGNWIRTNRQVINMVPGNMKEFFTVKMASYEVESLKFLLNAKSERRDKAWPYMFFVSKKLVSREKKITEAETTDGMIDALSGTGYGKLLRKAKDGEKDLTTELDSYYFRKLWEASGKLPGGDRKTARKLLGTEIDALNIRNVMRARARGIETERPYIPVFYKLRESVLRECMKAADVKGMVSVLGRTPYSSVLDSALQEYESTGSLFSFEQELRRYVLKVYRKAMLEPFGIGPILAYLKIKETEIANLRFIALGIENGVERKETEEMLVL